MGSVSLLVNDVSNVSIVYCTYNILNTETTKVDSCSCRYTCISCGYIASIYRKYIFIKNSFFFFINLTHTHTHAYILVYIYRQQLFEKSSSYHAPPPQLFPFLGFQSHILHINDHILQKIKIYFPVKAPPEEITRQIHLQ